MMKCRQNWGNKSVYSEFEVRDINVYMLVTIQFLIQCNLTEKVDHIEVSKSHEKLIINLNKKFL